MAKQINQIVKFLRSKSPYNSGDVAGFPTHVAHILISNGFAEPVDSKGQWDQNYRGMSWFKLRSEVKKLTGESPDNKEHAMMLLQQKGLV